VNTSRHGKTPLHRPGGNITAEEAGTHIIMKVGSFDDTGSFFGRVRKQDGHTQNEVGGM
jgi:hypothetical protein